MLEAAEVDMDLEMGGPWVATGDQVHKWIERVVHIDMGSFVEEIQAQLHKVALVARLHMVTLVEQRHEVAPAAQLHKLVYGQSQVSSRIKLNVAI